jgi:hypothetical protein
MHGEYFEMPVVDLEKKKKEREARDGEAFWLGQSTKSR